VERRKSIAKAAQDFLHLAELQLATGAAAIRRVSVIE
jgi:hypothetical protein